MCDNYCVNITLSKRDYDLLTNFSSLMNTTKATILANFAIPQLRNLDILIGCISDLPDEDETKCRVREAYRDRNSLYDLLEMVDATVGSEHPDNKAW